jgi:hypothetical protein
MTDANAKLTEVVSVRFATEELARLRVAAELRGVGVSAVIRRAVLDRGAGPSWTPQHESGATNDQVIAGSWGDSVKVEYRRSRSVDIVNNYYAHPAANV